MKFNYISKEEFDYVACIIHFVTGYEMSYFTKTIYHRKNRVKSLLDYR